MPKIITDISEYIVDNFKDKKQFDNFVKQISTTYLKTKLVGDKLIVINPKHKTLANAYYLGFIDN